MYFFAILGFLSFFLSNLIKSYSMLLATSEMNYHFVAFPKLFIAFYMFMQYAMNVQQYHHDDLYGLLWEITVSMEIKEN